MTRVTTFESNKRPRHRPIKVVVPHLNAHRLHAKAVPFVNPSKSIFKNDAMESHQFRELAQAVESASEWNSLLTTARAERGPQWDVGTQLFLVDHGSTLYYDPTPLLEAVREKQKQEDQTNGTGKKPEPGPQYPRDMPHHPHMNSMSAHGREASPRHPGGHPHPHMSQMGGGPGGFPYGGPANPRAPPMNGMNMGMPGGQFYQNGQGGMGGGGPNMGMGMDPMSPEMARRRSTRGTPMGYDFGEERFPMR